MGLSAKIKQLTLQNQQVAFRPAEVYTVAVGAYTLFSVANGAIYIHCLGARVTAAAVGATEVICTVNTVATDAAAVACNGAVGTVVLTSLNVAGTEINAVAIPETVATQSRMLCGTQVAGPGLIATTFSVGTSWTGEWFMIYTPLSPNVLVY